jgi:hypothetical protein
VFEDVQPWGWILPTMPQGVGAGRHNRQFANGWDAAMDQRTVLVIEDGAAVRSLIAELLADAGYAVLEADRGKMAPRLAREHAPAVATVVPIRESSPQRR